MEVSRYPKLWPYLLSVMGLLFLLYLKSSKPPEKKLKPLIFPQLGKEQIVKVKITKFPNSQSPRKIILRKDRFWLALTPNSSEFYPADKRAVKILLKRIVSLREGDPVSDDPGKHSIFQVDGSYLKVEVFSEGTGGPTLFYIGKNGPNLSGTYFRKGDSNEVFLLRWNIHLSFDRYEWRKKELFDFSEDRLTRLVIVFNNKTNTINIGDGWLINNQTATPGEQKIIKELSKEICRLRAADFASDRDKPVFDPDNLLIIKLTTSGLPEKKLFIGGERNPTLIYAKMEGKKEIFMLLSQKVDKIKKLCNQLK